MMIYLTQQQNDILTANNTSTTNYLGKLKALAQAYNEAQNDDEFVITEADAKLLFTAVMYDNWGIDSGLCYINIGETINMPLFLKKNTNEISSEKWKITDIDDADLFNKEELAEVLAAHPEYNQEAFVLKEHIAVAKWKQETSEEKKKESHEDTSEPGRQLEEKNDTPEKQDDLGDIRTYARAIHAVMEEPHPGVMPWSKK